MRDKRLLTDSISVDFSVLLSRFSIQRLGGHIDRVYSPPILESKSVQNNPKTRRNLNLLIVSKAIEPSEIIIDESGLPREETFRVNPWIRCLARFFDYALFFLCLWGLRLAFHGHFPLSRFEHLIPFEFFAWIPLEAFLLYSWGTTPGKFFLKIHLKQGRKARLDFTTAIRRSFNVWFRGLGMGIPIINFFCLLVAYQRLRLFRQTSWDREENIVVTHSPVGRWRVVVAAILAIGGLLFYYTDKGQEMRVVQKSEAR